MYNREKAIEYAYTWWNKRNPKFYNFDELGGDCTNFVSQCLYYGGINMNYTHLGWFYKSLNYRSPSWTGVDEFYSFSMNNNYGLGVKCAVSNLKDIKMGDIVQLQLNNENEFQHTALITKIINEDNKKNVFITCHSYDAKDKSISSYNYKNIRFLKILN
ncbi:MAG TPA: amidase [Clostridiales bacterium]|nr:amidase [Clostridiales bacterium]